MGYLLVSVLLSARKIYFINYKALLSRDLKELWFIAFRLNLMQQYSLTTILS